MSFTTKLFINDPSLSSGRHHIVTPIALSYGGKDNEIMVYNVPFTIAGKNMFCFLNVLLLLFKYLEYIRTISKPDFCSEITVDDKLGKFITIES